MSETDKKPGTSLPKQQLIWGNRPGLESGKVGTEAQIKKLTGF
ncbi:hypothetical protein PQO03_04955 [Lentisphaera profundi]|uniref:Uncharacterized protein n=1 Tax=Lentisphaera profundi TaxID=1658616 RepID=A0ABY7VVR2_9BACT|nr:hypothetical protein [Lentisphaera profundi]WDE97300.1 hypothetical protein PQO03_04955 [Lentisphaera profundi]